VIELLRRWGRAQSQGMSVELVDVNGQLPIVCRNTIANMMTEAEAQNGVFAPDDITAAWYRAPDALQRRQRAITSFNRNWQNRMGIGGEGYLASPAVVAASALAVYMAPPGELGLKWDPNEFGV